MLGCLNINYDVTALFFFITRAYNKKGTSLDHMASSGSRIGKAMFGFSNTKWSKPHENRTFGNETLL